MAADRRLEARVRAQLREPRPHSVERPVGVREGAAGAQAAGLVAQLAAEGEALKVARLMAAQIAKFDSSTRAAAKKFIKPIPYDELRQEIDLFCELFARPAVMAALKKFVEATDAMPYLP